MSSDPGDAGGGKATSDDLGLASLAAGGIGLSISMVTVFGPRGIGVSLGIIALVLGFVSWRRAGQEADESGRASRGMAYGSLALALVTVVVALLVALERL